MKLRHLSVNNFRGISKLDLPIRGDCVCLIGAGDSCKTTVLDSISYVLSPLWNIAINDLDFYDCNPKNPIDIRATIGEVPEEFLEDERFGMYLREWDGTKIIDEPTDDFELVLTIQCLIDHTFEPSWTVVTDRHKEGKLIRSVDRAKIGAIKLEAFSDRNFSWSKTSLLNRLVDNAQSDISKGLASIGRTAKESFNTDCLDSLLPFTEPLLKTAKSFGVSVAEIVSHLDVSALSVNSGGISLHEKNVPLRKFGTGTKRLLAYSISSKVHEGKSILLIDELEVGLEPNRITRLVRNFKNQPTQQVFLTTHSPGVLRELTIDDIYIVHKQGGSIAAECISNNLGPDQKPIFQALIREGAEAFLSPRIIVCEGKTEYGVLKAFDDFWNEKSKSSFASSGVSLFFGNGASQFDIAERLIQLGYQTSLFCDSDVAGTIPKIESLVGRGIEVVYWSNSCCIEQRFFLDATAKSVHKAIDFVASNSTEKSVIDQIRIYFPTAPLNRSEWVVDETMRKAIGACAKKSNWFKRIDLGEELGKLIIEDCESIQTSDLIQKINKIKSWVHGDEVS